MRVPLKGIAKVTKVLADGSRREYFYAWRGGPRIEGKPGTTEFINSFHALTSSKVAPRAGVLLTVTTAYSRSGEFARLAPRTRADYSRMIAAIEKEFGDLPLKALSDPRTRGVFLEWRDRTARSSPRQADYLWQVLKLILEWGKDRGLCDVNPAAGGGKLYQGSRVDQIWSDEHVDSFLANAPKIFHLPLLLGLWTGQREGDLIALNWSAYDGAMLKLTQSKTGARVLIPVFSVLKAALDKASRVGPKILVNTHGRPWKTAAFARGWGLACRQVGIKGLTFHDLRGSCVTRMAKAGATVPEICAVTGHSLKDATAILERHYLSKDPAIAANAIRKLEEENIRRSTLQTEPQTGGKS